MNLEDNEELSFQEKLEKFIKVLKQEILNPDILVFERELYTSLLSETQLQNARIKEYVGPEKNLPKGGSDDQTSHIKNMKQQIYRAETEKIEYLLKEYIRTRLAKIEKFCFYLYKNQNIAERKLSDHEKNFLKLRAEQKFKAIEETVLVKLPKMFRGFAGLETFFSKDRKKEEIKSSVESKQSRVEIIEPNLQTFVFCHVKENPQQERLKNIFPSLKFDEHSVLPVNSTVFSKYEMLGKFIERGQGELI